MGCVLLLLALLQTGIAHAAEDPYDPVGDRPWQLTSFASESETANARVFDIAFETNGTVWLATTDGLRRYDGYQWQRLDTNHNLPSSFIRSVCVSREGKIYGIARDFTRGLLHFCEWNGQRFERVSAVFLHPPEGRLYKMAEAPDGSLWCVGYGTVGRWHPGAPEWKFHPNLPPPHTVVGTKGIWFGGRSNVVAMTNGRFIPVDGMRQILAVDPQGAAWGINPKGDRLLRAELDRASKPTVVDCGLERHQMALTDAQGRLWVFGRSSKVTAAARCWQGGKWLEIDSPELANYRILASTADSAGTVLIAIQRDPSVEFQIARISEGQVSFESADQTPKSIVYPTLTSGAGFVWLHGYANLYRRPIGTQAPWERVTDISDNGFQQTLVTDQEVLTLFYGGRGGKPGCAFFHQGRWTTNRPFAGWWPKP
jgi:hypothetical protein